MGLPATEKWVVTRLNKNNARQLQEVAWIVITTLVLPHNKMSIWKLRDNVCNNHHGWVLQMLLRQRSQNRILQVTQHLCEYATTSSILV